MGFPVIRTVRLTGVWLTGVRLKGVWLTGVRLTGVRLAGVRLKGTEYTKFDIQTRESPFNEKSG